MDIVIIGAGPAGLVAAMRAAELGARTVLVTRGEVGGMAANDGPGNAGGTPSTRSAKPSSIGSGEPCR